MNTMKELIFHVKMTRTHCKKLISTLGCVHMLTWCIYWRHNPQFYLFCQEACDWEEKVKELKLDIEKLTKQRDQLEFLLQVHTATCSMINRPIPSQRLEDLLPEESISTAATSISASSTTVTAPVFVPPPPTSNQVQLTSTSASQSALPPLSEVVKTDVLSVSENLLFCDYALVLSKILNSVACFHFFPSTAAFCWSIRWHSCLKENQHTWGKYTVPRFSTLSLQSWRIVPWQVIEG